MANQSPLEQVLADYLSGRSILVVDPNGPSRAGVAKMLVGLGAKTSNIKMVNDFQSGLEIIRNSQPPLVVSEYQLTGGNGLDLSQEMADYKEKNTRVFVLMTNNSSQSLVAQAAEEDVDVFILKPYTAKHFSEILMKVVGQKVQPSDYQKLITEGKKLLFEAKPDEAIAVFNKAAPLDPKPALALYYRGQAELLKKLMDEAEGSYKDGLNINDVHFKCLTGLFDLLMSRKKTVDAYAVVRRIAKYFPANPKRLSQVLTLAVNTGNVKDIEEYYEAFKTIDSRNEELVKYVCAGMVVAGRHFMRTNNKTRGVDILKKSAISAAGRPNILREIVSTLVEYRFLTEAKDVFKRFGADQQKSPHFQISAFLLFQAEELDSKRNVAMATDLIKQDIKDSIVYYWLIYHLTALGRNDEAEKYREEAEGLYPKERDYFVKAIAMAPKPG